MNKKILYINNLNLIENKDNNYKYKNINYLERELLNLRIKDMMFLIKTIRQIKGLPSNSQSTRTNSRSCKKNKKLLNFRVDQYFKVFGVPKRNIYPTLIQGEYYNRLWNLMWYDEWIQGKEFLTKLVTKKQTVALDIINLARGQTNGYIRVGAASKLGKSKKITNIGTIGVPIFFSFFFLTKTKSKEFQYLITIDNESRKKMGKKFKRKKSKLKKKKKKKNETKKI